MKVKEAKFRTPVKIPRSTIVAESPMFVDINDGCVCTADSHGNMTIAGPKGSIMVPGTNVAYFVAFPTEIPKSTSKK